MVVLEMPQAAEDATGNEELNRVPPLEIKKRWRRCAPE
jgi:hypothetical protein